MADLVMKCAHCGKELLGDVYRVDQGSFSRHYKEKTLISLPYTLQYKSAMVYKE